MNESLAALYDALIAAIPGSTPREGQRRMLQAIGEQLAEARFEPDAPLRALVLEAGTGVGKTRAYLAAGLTLARERGVKLVVATSTVALQEQVIHKDLPELSAALEVPPTVALLKGRGRYACPVRMAQALGQGDGQNGGQEPLDFPLTPGAGERLATLQRRLRQGDWNGERDSLAPADLEHWSAIAAERGACTARHCPQFNACPYFDAKRAASKAEILVANHDLVLASLRSDASSLPSGDRALYVFDEAHHLPATALHHFACEATLTERRWLQRLEKALLAAATGLRYPGKNFDGCTALLVQSLDELTRALMQVYGPEAIGQMGEQAEADEPPPMGAVGASAPAPTRIRLPDGRWPEQLVPIWQDLAQAAERLHSQAAELSAWMRELRAADEDLAEPLALYTADIGPPHRRLAELLDLARLMLTDGEPPPAKWLDFDVQGEHLRLQAKACPVSGAAVLRQHLWSRLRGAVLTSATLRALGRFDFFLRESGLANEDGVQALAVDSPFDHAHQGRFEVVETRASPKAPQAHTAEVATLLQDDLLAVEHGALLLCSSWVQLRALVAAMPPALRRQMRVQGEAPREQLLREHRAAVAAGERAVLVGLQSFGEGLDLPGRECEWVFLPKLPFLMPADPVMEARAEWLQAQGRNPFLEIVVPATGVRLNQWAGRGIRSETDRATIVCYDGRLSQTAFGRQLLAGLPPFSRWLRKPGQAASPLSG
ncbi:MAG: ATP-dependent DNA helicase DinG [Burkholderiales bacterium]|nr:ATP-dependent DNA helicase DinG [Burkholderiales bacterium]